ncbi:hypothetical protein HID58_083047 [Brassica napus]|uniref:Phosphofructokinase domain-containing protein n=1 Tax=Brassica napus TaxID=3708 RepID=A0ABQ7YC80_BRANA|nr:hypothetical protein HID58_083047 [Brassica napus]
METLSPPIITSTVSIPYSNGSVLVRSHGLSSLILRKPRSPAANPSLISSRSSFNRASAVEHGKTSVSIDLSDPNWKRKYEREFEERFSIPHITDVFPDAEAIRSTFCLKMRSPTEDFVGGYPSDEEWHGYINNNDRVLLKVISYSSPTSAGAECIDSDCSWVEQWIHRAGPREKIYFRPEQVKAAIITCGGLCPGLNDVIRHIVITLEIYGVKNIVGIPFGYKGFSDKDLTEMPLSRKVVQNIHLSGGSLLGVSRGGPSVSEIVDSMEERGINMLFVLGGNGTHAGANAIHDECRKRKMKVAVVGVPKTIDNDILHMDKTFGFDTAVEEAQRAINSAYIEVPFNIHGPNGVLKHLKYLIETKGSAVICVAEGAGQNLLEKTNAKDASGNTILGDFGVHIQQETKKYFKEVSMPVDVKYIDPTYMIRAVRANASDGILCTVLGQNAVHGAFAGYSGITVGIINTHYAYLPIPEIVDPIAVIVELNILQPLKTRNEDKPSKTEGEKQESED